MCGRYLLTSPVESMRTLFDVLERPNLQPRFNIAPTQDIAAVRRGEEGARHLVLLRWGLIPHWAKEASIGARMINARAESVAEKPAFRSAFRHRRCLIPADGFYEWQARGKGPKQPYVITLAEDGLMAFAGLWESWRDPESGVEVESATIITTDANAGLSAIHPRMPVIVDPADFETWLDPQSELEDLRGLLRPPPEERTVARPISTRVNRVANDDPAILDALAEPEGEAQRRRGKAGGKEQQGRLL